jgi:hypothetical protein
MIKILYFLLVLITGLSSTGCNIRHNGSDSNSQDSPHEPVEIVPDIVVPQLPGQLNESSALMIFRDLLWTINDSGGEAALYSFDRNTGEVKQVVRIENGENDDWESLASSDKQIFIGDFGNNRGNRKNLGIYILDKSDIPVEGDITLRAEQIEFSYPGQVNFTFGMNNNPYDCEAFIWFGDSLFLFSKDWVTRKTKVYALPARPGIYSAELVDSFAVECLVTGADISRNMKKLVLLGYADYVPYIWYFDGIEKGNLLGGRKTRYSMMEYFGTQTEGIAFSGNDTLFISSEQSQLPSRIYRYVLPPNGF